MANRKLITASTVLFTLFFLLIIVPSVFFGKMWGQYEILVENPELFGLVDYIINSPDFLYIGYMAIVFIVMMVLIFKIRKGRIT